MGVLVKDIVELPIMKSSKIKVGRDMMQDKLVEWVSVIEQPVENFVRKNEFVLSTGIGCGEKPRVFESFVKDVIQSGASVLALATGRYVYTIPDNVLKLAQNNNLILIEVPWEVRFAEIMQTVMEKITLDKQEEHKRAEDVRHALINCVLQDKGLQEICYTLYKYIQIPLAIVDSSKAVRARKYFDKDILTRYTNMEKQPLQPVTPSDMQFSEHPLYYHLDEYNVEGKSFFQLKIVNNHKSQGYILIQPKKRELLTLFVMNVLEHALTAFALYFVKENAIELTEIRLKDNFVLNLTQQKAAIDDPLLSKAKLLGYDLHYTYACLVGDMSKHESVNQGDKENSSLQSLNYYIQKEIHYAAGLVNRRAMTTFYEGEVIIYLQTTKESYSEVANQFLDTIERRLSELLSGLKLSWGIAPPSTSEHAFYQSYQEAKTALKIGKQQHGSEERTFFGDTKINRLLLSLSSDNEIMNVVTDTLTPLIEYDNKRQTDLIHTFLVYNKYKGNVSQTARALNLHRQSLLHRLRNIESLTQLSLIDSDDSFLLELSVRLWMLNDVE